MFIFSKLFSLIYLGQVWSQNLKFLKLTEICYSRRWPCADFHFNVYLFKILFVHIWRQILSRKWTSSNWLKFGTEVDDHGLVSIIMFIFSNFLFIHIFFVKFGLIIWSFSDWLKFGTEIDYLILIANLMFIFSKLFSLIDLGQVWSQNLKFVKLTEVWYRGRLPYTYLELNFFFFQNSFLSYFWGKFRPKIWGSSNWLKFRTEVDGHVLISILMFIFWKPFSFIFWVKYLPKYEVLENDWNLVQR